MSTDTIAALLSILEKDLKLGIARPEDALADIGLDSLSLLHLSLAVERRFGVKLPARGVLGGETTITALADWIGSKQAPAQP